MMDPISAKTRCYFEGRERAKDRLTIRYCSTGREPHAGVTVSLSALILLLGEPIVCVMVLFL
jgi:hypothetical protein